MSMTTLSRPVRATVRPGHWLLIVVAVLFCPCLLCQSTPAFMHSEIQEILRNFPSRGFSDRMKKLEDHSFEHWWTLPKSSHKKLLRRHWKRVAHEFATEHMKLRGPGSLQFHELVHACEHALGRDIDVQSIGSRARGTAAFFDCDLDLQVRSSAGSSHRMRHLQILTSRKWHETSRSCHS